MKRPKKWAISQTEKFPLDRVKSWKKVNKERYERLKCAEKNASNETKNQTGITERIANILFKLETEAKYVELRSESIRSEAKTWAEREAKRWDWDRGNEWGALNLERWKRLMNATDISKEERRRGIELTLFQRDRDEKIEELEIEIINIEIIIRESKRLASEEESKFPIENVHVWKDKNPERWKRIMEAEKMGK